MRGLPGRPGTLAWSVQEWAVRDLAQHALATQAGLLSLADRLGADSGFITLDVVRAMSPSSPWELAVGQPPTRRDLRSEAWGFGWGTLLGPVQVAALGEATLARLPEAVPAAVVSRREDGAAWIRLGADPREVTRDHVRRLRDVLLPALPVGTHTVGHQAAPTTRPQPPYLV